MDVLAPARVKNRRSLLQAAPAGHLRARRALALDAVEAALAVVEPQRATQEAIDDWLKAGHDLADAQILAIGKAAPAMTQGALCALGERPGRGIALSQFGVGSLRLEKGAHPTPSDQSLVQGEALLRWADGLGEADQVLGLISGGASSLLVAPKPGVSLDDLQHTYALLVGSGAPIEAINAVRRRLSRVKGGGLLRAIRPARLALLVLSDTPGQPLSVVGSGPLLPPRPIEEEDELIHGLVRDPGLPVSVRQILAVDEEELEPVEAPELCACIADNARAVEAMTQWLLASMPTFGPLKSESLHGEARDAGRRLAKTAQEQGGLWILGGECTVDLGDSPTHTPDGKRPRGGRGLEFVLGASAELQRGALVLSLATDGQDGNSGLAGALWDEAAAYSCRARGLDVRSALARHESAPLFEEIGASIYTGSTGTNVADVAVLIPPDPKPAT